MSKSISNIVKAFKSNFGSGAFMYNPIPHVIEQISPFVMLDHFIAQKVPANYHFDFPPHPHKGFSAVSILLKGTIVHKDSLGNKGKILGGDVQWMSAGNGVVHSESLINESETPDSVENIQLWINSPAEKKKLKPSYQDTKAEKFPIYEKDGATLKVITGTFNSLKGPISTQTPLSIFMGSLKKDAAIEIVLPTSYNVALYITSGTILINKQEIEKYHLVTFANDGDNFYIKALTENCEFIVLGGEPINEPMVSHGPFVMNTKKEIEIAIQEYQSGKMGEIK